MKRPAAVVLVLVVLAIGVAAFMGSGHAKWERNVQARSIVFKALSRQNGADYTAHVVTILDYGGKSILTNATVFHRAGEQKIEYSGSNKREAWSMTKGGETYTFVPGQNKLLVSGTGSLLSDNDRARLIERNFRAEYVGVGEVAGRKAYIVNLAARDGSRPAKKLWIDEHYYTILRSIDYGANGEQRGSTQTVRIDYKASIPPDTFKLPDNASVKRAVLCVSGDSPSLYHSLVFPAKTPKFIPAGYALEGYHLFNCQCGCGGVSAQLTYTDGLNMISLFENPLSSTCCGNGCNMKNCGGRCCVRGQGIASTGNVTRKDKTVVVVGDLMPEDVRRMAESVD